MPTPIAAPPKHADEIGVKTKQRHHQNQRDHARQHQKLQRRKAHGGEGVDFLSHFHRAELRGEGRAGSARHDDAGHHRAHLANHRDADEIRDIDLRAELF